MSDIQVSPVASLGYFAGINTVEDPVRLRPQIVNTLSGNKAAYALVSATNVDIDNDHALSSRTGITLRLSGTDIHSLWANVAGDLCFFMDGGTLYQLQHDWSITEMKTGLANVRMSFAEFNDRVYFSNGSDIGYLYSSAAYNLTTQSMTYKQALPAGRFLCVYRGCLYVARGNVLYISDPLSDCYDIRTGYRTFKESVTMVLPVDEGIYVSEESTWFLAGRTHTEFQRILVDQASALEYTGQVMKGEEIGEGLEGFVGLWTTRDGICLGDNRGVVRHLTEDRYVMPDCQDGAALIRDTNGLVQYLSIVRG